MGGEMVQPEMEQLLDAKGLATLLRRSVKSLYNQRASGADLPPAIKLPGGAVRWDPEDVRRWLESHREDTAVREPDDSTTTNGGPT
jgi:predicted DNA-binding transcriptional regulator AlpA